MADLIIQAVKTISDNQPTIRRLAEKATQTFKSGAVVLVEAASGFLIESAPIVAVGVRIAGIASEFGHNQTTSGVAKEDTAYGSVQNQPLATLIAPGGRPNDGKAAVYMATEDTIFLGKVRDADSLVVTDIGLIFGLTKNANGIWEVDKSKATAAAGAIVTIRELIDPVGTAGGKVLFQVNSANRQFPQ